MKNWLIGAVIVGMTASLVPTDADARRFGGGRSQGMQRSAPPPPPPRAPDAPPARPVTPAQQAAPAAGAAAAPAAAAATRRSWMGPIAGLAAGLGLAALMSHLGFGEAFANFIMMALLAVVAIVAIRFLMRRFAGGNGNGSPAMNYAGAGAGAGGAGGGGGQPFGGSAGSPFGGSPGSPAAGSPWARPEVAAPTSDAPRVEIGSNVPGYLNPLELSAPASAMPLPAGFDAAGFERLAKMIFIRLQAANDTADLNDIRNFTTPEMYAAVKLDLQDRGTQTQHTDVVQVDAQVLEVAEEADRQVVSVRFHGLIREDVNGPTQTFDEVWHLVKPADDSRSWAIAGIQQRD